MSAINRLYLIVLVIIIILCTMLAIYVYIALVPYFRIVGYIGLALLIIIALCAIAFILVFTFSKTSIMLSERQQALNKRSLLTHGEIAVWIRPDGSYIHISALHEAAKSQQIPQTVDADTPAEIEAYKDYKAEDIVKWHAEGMSERAIAERIGMSKTTVHNVIKQYS